jgi:excisionase family DNA binding protein
MKLSLSQAAKETAVSKPTLSRWIKNGRVSAKKLDDGSYEIDASELDRIKDMKNKGGNSNPSAETKMQRSETPNETTVLQREISVLREERERERCQMQSTIDDLREDRDQWRRQATALLTDQREKSEAPVLQPSPSPQPEQPSSSPTWLTIAAIMIISAAVFIFIRVAYGVTG